MNILTKDVLKKTLGSFWEEFFNRPELLDGWMQGLSLHHRQLQQNLQEMIDTTSVEKTPETHVELWRSLKLVQDRETGSFYPLKYDEVSGVYGQEGHQPFHDKQFVYGGNTDHRGLGEATLTPDKVLFISDSIHNPTFVLVDGIDFHIQNGVIIFVDDLNDNEAARATVESNLSTGEDVYGLWGYYCEYDMEFAARQWGYLISFEQSSSKTYNRALWELWKARRFGMSPEIFDELVSIYLRCPRCEFDGEIVEGTYEDLNGGTVILTDRNVYSLTAGDNPVIPTDKILTKGQFLGDKVTVLETGKSTHLRDGLNRNSKYHEVKMLGDSGVVETNYIHFNADVAPSTIRKVTDTDYTPSYAVLDTPHGRHNVRVLNLFRFSKCDFTLEIETSMLTGPQTKTASVQVYSVLGEPLFKEPYTGNVDPVPGIATFITDADDALKINEDALTDAVDEVDRVVLITMFEDIETSHIKQSLESLRFSDNRVVSVTTFPSVSVYTDLPVEGNSFTTTDKVHLLNFDMVMLNTGSGVMSTVDGYGNLNEGPTITDNEFIANIVSTLDKQIGDLEKEIYDIDNDLIWLLNYTQHDSRHADFSWLYQIVGTRGIPHIHTNSGDAFYNCGLFASLDPETVVLREDNNRKTKATFEIPKVPWASSTGLGVVTKEINIPVYSKRIEVSGSSPRLETTLEPGHQYIYKVSSLELDVS